MEGPCDKDPRFPFIRDRKLEVILDAWKARESVSDMVLGACWLVAALVVVCCN